MNFLASSKAAPAAAHSASPSLKDYDDAALHAGFQNLGNTCFLNSVLQATAATRTLRRLYQPDEDSIAAQLAALIEADTAARRGSDNPDEWQAQSVAWPSHLAQLTDESESVTPTANTAPAPPLRPESRPSRPNGRHDVHPDVSHRRQDTITPGGASWFSTSAGAREPSPNPHQRSETPASSSTAPNAARLAELAAAQIERCRSPALYVADAEHGRIDLWSRHAAAHLSRPASAAAEHPRAGTPAAASNSGHKAEGVTVSPVLLPQAGAGACQYQPTSADLPLNTAFRRVLEECWARSSNENASASSSSKKVKVAPVNPQPLLDEMASKYDQYGEYGQQDGHELLRHLLDSMRMEEMDLIKKLQPPDPRKAHKRRARRSGQEGGQVAEEDALRQRYQLTPFVDSLFCGKLLSAVVCEGCRSVSHTYEDFFDISLPVRPELAAKAASKRNRIRNMAGRWRRAASGKGAPPPDRARSANDHRSSQAQALPSASGRNDGTSDSEAVASGIDRPRSAMPVLSPDGEGPGSAERDMMRFLLRRGTSRSRPGRQRERSGACRAPGPDGEAVAVAMPDLGSMTLAPDVHAFADAESIFAARHEHSRASAVRSASGSRSRQPSRDRDRSEDEMGGDGRQGFHSSAVTSPRMGNGHEARPGKNVGASGAEKRAQAYIARLFSERPQSNPPAAPGAFSWMWRGQHTPAPPPLPSASAGSGEHASHPKGGHGQVAPNDFLPPRREILTQQATTGLIRSMDAFTAVEALDGDNSFACKRCWRRLNPPSAKERAERRWRRRQRGDESVEEDEEDSEPSSDDHAPRSAKEQDHAQPGATQAPGIDSAGSFGEHRSPKEQGQVSRSASPSTYAESHAGGLTNTNEAEPRRPVSTRAAALRDHDRTLLPETAARLASAPPHATSEDDSRHGAEQRGGPTSTLAEGATPSRSTTLTTLAAPDARESPRPPASGVTLRAPQPIAPGSLKKLSHFAARQAGTSDESSAGEEDDDASSIGGAGTDTTGPFLSTATASDSGLSESETSSRGAANGSRSGIRMSGIAPTGLTAPAAGSLSTAEATALEGAREARRRRATQSVPRRALKRYLIAELPPVLVMHLKRFEIVARGLGGFAGVHGGSTKKIDDFVSFPEYLDAAPWLAPPREERDRYGRLKSTSDPVAVAREAESIAEANEEQHHSRGSRATRNGGANGHFHTVKHHPGHADRHQQHDKRQNNHHDQREHHHSLWHWRGGGAARQANRKVKHGSSSGRVEEPRTLYRLYAVIVHQGNMTSGHYTAFVLSDRHLQSETKARSSATAHRHAPNGRVADAGRESRSPGELTTDVEPSSRSQRGTSSNAAPSTDSHLSAGEGREGLRATKSNSSSTGRTTSTSSASSSSRAHSTAPRDSSEVARRGATVGGGSSLELAPSSSPSSSASTWNTHATTATTTTHTSTSSSSAHGGRDSRAESRRSVSSGETKPTSVATSLSTPAAAGAKTASSSRQTKSAPVATGWGGGDGGDVGGATPTKPHGEAKSTKVGYDDDDDDDVHHGDDDGERDGVASASTTTAAAVDARKWVFASDTMVRPASIEEVLKARAYMLFYEQV